jgi:hypothetical protein
LKTSQWAYSFIIRRLVQQVKERVLKKWDIDGDTSFESEDLYNICKKIPHHIQPNLFLSIFSKLKLIRVAFVFYHAESFVGSQQIGLFDEFCKFAHLTGGNTISYFVSDVHLEYFNGKFYPLEIYFPQYDPNQLCSLLVMLCPEESAKKEFRTFVNVFIGSFKSTTRNLSDLMEMIPSLFAKYQMNPKSILQDLKMALSKYDHVDQGNDDTEFSIIEKYMLVASWLCSHVETKKVFVLDRKKLRKSEKQVVDLNKMFDLHELINVTVALAENNELEEQHDWIAYDLSGFVHSLVARNYLRLKTKELFTPKFESLIDEATAQKIATSLKIVLDKYKSY